MPRLPTFEGRKQATASGDSGPSVPSPSAPRRHLILNPPD
jgi:hypothetical protein